MLSKRLNEWSRPDFKFGPFKLRGVVHLVVYLGEVIRMCHLLNLEEVRVEGSPNCWDTERRSSI